jgi:hypothetical protein
MAERIRLLVAVKTYPIPTANHGESVCTGGFLPDGSFIRLHPIDFRAMPAEGKYKLWQWIELDVEKSKEDKRLESFNPKSEITIVKQRTSFEERYNVILRREWQSMCELNDLDKNVQSVGVAHVRAFKSIKYESRDPNWKPKQEVQTQQGDMFHERTPLEKVPYKFTIEYLCDTPDCSGHKQSYIDWQVGVVWRKTYNETGSDEAACKRVCEGFYNNFDPDNKELYLLVGTEPRWGNFIIGGIFSFSRTKQQSRSNLLFD